MVVTRDYCPVCLKDYEYKNGCFVGAKKISITCPNDREFSGSLHKCKCGGIIAITAMDDIGSSLYLPSKDE